jgi:hypothetical protein
MSIRKLRSKGVIEPRFVAGQQKLQATSRLEEQPSSQIKQTRRLLPHAIEAVWPSTYTSMLYPERIARAANTRGMLLQLQVSFGNRYVQRVLELASTHAHKIYLGTHILGIIQRQAEERSDEIKSKAKEKLDQETLREVTATVLAEAAENQEEAIGWIYYNHVSSTGKKGLDVSTAHKYKSDWYKVWMVALGDKAFANDSPKKKELKSYGTIRDYVEKNGWFKKIGQPRAARIEEKIRGMFGDPSKNPYRGWLGQGSIDDLNLNYGKWRKARQYLHLQLKGEVIGIYVKVLPGDPISVIFDEKAIEKYFKNNPDKLPEKVKKYSP